MNIISFFKRPTTAPVAKDRLKLLLAHERAAVGASDVIALLREEIIAVIAKHFPVESDAITVRMESGDVISTLEVEVEIPTPLCVNVKMNAEEAKKKAELQKLKPVEVTVEG
ncbi:Cell division topological specificity factor [Methylocella tundrae]|uniref:Cell division topological specificity factor n=1 Tax=Methylocella tundrae TaxID=227605 RepID=A0A8B6M270_METTU|nr:cell division topological specificity factor MinE [Methylocella tundrae]VTZ28048.1 Cell division topological specificity factor [Methylocella tundrae]VTZ48928.1 Cell division topological specificity factor [Methylocella tundrae]